MNKQLFFLIIACSLFVLSIIAINVAPIISKANNNINIDWSEWANQNCQKMDDDYKFDKNNHIYDDQTSKTSEKIRKRKIDECKKHKVMFGLEYSTFVIDICPILISLPSTNFLELTSDISVIPTSTPLPFKSRRPRLTS